MVYANNAVFSLLLNFINSLIIVTFIERILCVKLLYGSMIQWWIKTSALIKFTIVECGGREGERWRGRSMVCEREKQNEQVGYHYGR